MRDNLDNEKKNIFENRTTKERKINITSVIRKNTIQEKKERKLCVIILTIKKKNISKKRTTKEKKKSMIT